MFPKQIFFYRTKGFLTLLGGSKENIGKKRAELKYHFIRQHHYWTLSWVGKFIGNRREITQIIWTYQISITFSKILKCYPIQMYLLRWWIYYRFLWKKLFPKIAIIHHQYFPVKFLNFKWKFFWRTPSDNCFFTVSSIDLG